MRVMRVCSSKLSFILLFAFFLNTCCLRFYLGLNTLSCFLHHPLTTTLEVQFGAVQMLTFTLPCFLQSPALPARALVVQSGARHNPLPPCLTQSPRPCALEVQPGCMHTPCAPCLTQSPRVCDLVVQPGWTHTVRVSSPCLQQSPCAAALVVQPRCTHTACEPPPCLTQSPRFFALVAHPGTVHTPFAPCLWQSCVLFTAMLVQFSVKHIPHAPCIMHMPRAFPCLVQPSIKHIGVMHTFCLTMLPADLNEPPSPFVPNTCCSTCADDPTGVPYPTIMAG
jgi:hypothetical protein